jgi:thiol-disulfide isomerase/thioredoxin
MRAVALLVAVAAVAQSVALEPSILVRALDPFGTPIAKDDDKVPSLTSANFDDFVMSKPLTVVAFVAPWCGFCKKLKPVFAKAAAELGKEFPDTMQLARVDCVAESELYDRFDIEGFGFPAIFLFHFGKLANVYQGRDLSYDAIRSFYRDWALQPDVHTGWLFAKTINDVFDVLEYDVPHHAYTSPIPTLLTLLDPTRINSDDSRMVLESLANASFMSETKHTRFVVTTDPAVMGEFMQITEDCGLTEASDAVASGCFPCCSFRLCIIAPRGDRVPLRFGAIVRRAVCCDNVGSPFDESAWVARCRSHAASRARFDQMFSASLHTHCMRRERQPPTHLPVSRLITSYDKPDVFLPPAMVRLSDMLAAFVHAWAWPDLVVHNAKNMS